MSLQSSGINKDPIVITGMMRAADLAILALTAVLAYWLRHGVLAFPGDYVIATVAGLLLAAQIFHSGGLYAFSLLDRPASLAVKLVGLMGLVALSLIAIGFFGKVSADFSRAWAVLWLGLSFVEIIVFRLWLRRRLARWRAAGIFTRNLAVVGATPQAQRLIGHLLTSSSPGIKVVGVFDDRASRTPDDLCGIPVLGTIDDLFALSHRQRIDEVVVALPWTAEERLLHIMDRLRALPVDVLLCPDGIGFRMFERRVSHRAGLPLLGVVERPLTGWSYLLKAAEDRILATLLLVVLWPLMLVIALAIKLDSHGPVLFRQPRYGFNNKTFEVLKFRTMRHGAPDPAAPPALRDDPRFTRLGRLLRRTSMDELPQLFNVLHGEMSLVGPRPHAVAHNEEYAKLLSHYLGRHRIKPGITGWAQVNGLRGEIDTMEKLERRVQYDLYYIDNWSLLLDLRILVKTLFVGLVHENAY